MKQHDSERFKDFEMRLKACAADCDFVCPFEATHDLTEYQMINRIRSGVYDPNLQHELLQKSDTLNSLALISAYCENVELAKTDREKLKKNPMSIAACAIPDQELSQEEVVGGISAYKRSKQQQNPDNRKDYETNKKCFKCGGKYPHPELQNVKLLTIHVRNVRKKDNTNHYVDPKVVNAPMIYRQ